MVRIRGKWDMKKVLLVTIILSMMSCALMGCQKIYNNKTEYDKTIVVGIDDFSPYSYKDENGKYKGIDVELAKLAFHKLGYDVTFKKIVWEDKNEDLDEGIIDCIWSCFSMNDREDLYQWAGPYLHSDQVVAVKKESGIQTLADLVDKRVGVQTSTKAEAVFLNREVKELLCFSQTNEVFSALSKNYVDAICGHQAMIQDYVNTDSKTYTILDDKPYESVLGVAFKKGAHKKLVKQLNNELQRLGTAGKIKKIVEKYGLSYDQVSVEGEYYE